MSKKKYEAVFEERFVRNLRRYAGIRQRVKRRSDRVITDPYANTSELKIELRLEHGQLGLYDPKTGKKLLTYEEAQDALQAEQGARRAAEAEAARLREELARLKGSG